MENNKHFKFMSKGFSINYKNLKKIFLICSAKGDFIFMKIAFFDTKPYDKDVFNELNKQYNFEIKYFESKLRLDTAILAKDHDAVCCFVNDDVDKQVIDKLYEQGIKVILLRCSGYDNVDIKYCTDKIKVLRVPSYSPTAVAEHAAALLLSINRRIHKAYTRTREFNFNINGLMGFDLRGKTAGVIGTGRIGKVMIEILKGFGMEIIAYDVFPDTESNINYVSIDELMKYSDIITLHCPLTDETKYIINKNTISRMKNGVILINTSRGALVDTDALIDALQCNKFTGVALDVYEEEDEYFFEDRSNDIINDHGLIMLTSYPNVLITSHQAFFTQEAMSAIAKVTLENLKLFETGGELENEVKIV